MIKTGLPIVTFVFGLVVGGSLAAKAVQSPGAKAEGPGVSGIGGVFFKADDPAELRTWYERHLGIVAGQQGVNFFWREQDDTTAFGRTVWSLFPRDTNYFGPSGQELMINYRVRDLDALLVRLQAEGVQQVGAIDEYWYGRFAWIVDGEGNRVELWEPVDHSPEEFERRLQDESSQ